MEQCLQCLCCCFDFGRSTPVRPASTRRRTKSARQTRLISKFKNEDFIVVSDEQRKSKKSSCYCCPICTNYYTKILACGECSNFICIFCFDHYDNKNVEKRTRMKCPFCNSNKSQFADYELEPHSYFDTTNKGFLSKQERMKIDAEIALKQPSKELKRLQNIEEIREQ